MKAVSRRTKRIIAGLTIIVNAELIREMVYLLYYYHSHPFLSFRYPDWALWTCTFLSGIGIYLSILLWKEKIRLKLFLILMLLIELVNCWSLDMQFQSSKEVENGDDFQYEHLT